MRCDEFLEHLDSYLADTLDGPDRASFREHLRNCSRCREVAIQAEPSLLFSALPSQEVDARRIENVTGAVLGQIRQERLERRLHRHRGRWLAAAAAIVMMVAGVTGWRFLSPDGGEVPPAIAEVSRTGESSPPPRVEVDMPGSGVRVYQYADQQDSDTAVYFIVNPSLEL